VREPGSRTLPVLVGCIVFSTKSKKLYTPLQSFGTQQRALFPLHTRCVQQVNPVAPVEVCGNLVPARSPLEWGVCFFGVAEKTYTPPEWAGTHLRACPARLHAELAG
jgi:hypothetical protein